MRIIYQNSDGGCSVIVPAPQAGLTIEEIAAKVVPPGTPYKIIADGEVPADRTYRNAWAADVANGAVAHDMPKAREIHKEHMRRSRTPLLATLDLAMVRADEKGGGGAAEKAAIIAEKQALRDVTLDTGIATAQTVEELKRVWPTALGANPLPQR